ncbi:15291_t:CDS:2, partial [Gigaspora margarita]
HDKNILVHGGRMIITDFGLSLSLDKDTLSITNRVYGRCEYSDPKYLPSPRKREAPIKGTPVDFKDLYDDAWGGDPYSRPDIRKICEKLNYIRLEQDSEMN